MKVSEGAWHVTVVRRLNHDYRPRDLCSHFWTVQEALAVWGVFGLLIIAAIGAVLTFVAWGLVAGPIIIGWPWSEGPSGWQGGVTGALYGLECIVLIVFAYGVLIYMLDEKWIGGGRAARQRRGAERRAQQTPKEPKPEKPLPPPKPSLLWAFLMARKRKVCPLIELVPEGKAVQAVKPG